MLCICSRLLQRTIVSLRGTKKENMADQGLKKPHMHKIHNKNSYLRTATVEFHVELEVAERVHLNVHQSSKPIQPESSQYASYLIRNDC